MRPFTCAERRRIQTIMTRKPFDEIRTCCAAIFTISNFRNAIGYYGRCGGLVFYSGQDAGSNCPGSSPGLGIVVVVQDT